MILINKIKGSDAARETLCYPLICAIFQLRIRRLQVQVLPDAPIKSMVLQIPHPLPNARCAGVCAGPFRFCSMWRIRCVIRATEQYS
jgi:hypothetical protein